MKTITRRAVAGLGAVIAVSIGFVTGPASARVPASGTSQPSRHVGVPLGRHGFELPPEIRAGWVTFRAHTHDPVGHQLEGFRTRHGASAAQVVQDIKDAVSFDAATSVAGTAATRRDAVLVGGPSVDPATPAVVTIALRPGIYHFFDFDDFFTPEQRVTLHTVRVVGRFAGHAPAAEAQIRTTMVDDQPRFRGPSRLPARRTIAVRNTGDELHEVLLQHVVPGTGNAEIQHYYESGSTDPASYALEPALRGVAAMDPGRVAYVRFPRLVAGRYALLCFVPDDENGLPHVVEGMHRVVGFHG